MKINKTVIEDLLIIENRSIGDERGFFCEWGVIENIELELKRKVNIAQFNHSHSKYNVLRGIHYENMDKIVYIPHGSAFCVWVDLRKDSKTFCKYVSMEINDNNRVTVFIPEGIGNSFLVTSEEPLDYIYLVSKKYKDTITRQVLWNDPDLNIPWPNLNPIISERDKKAQTVKEAFGLD